MWAAHSHCGRGVSCGTVPSRWAAQDQIPSQQSDPPSCRGNMGKGNTGTLLHATPYTQAGMRWCSCALTLTYPVIHTGRHVLVTVSARGSVCAGYWLLLLQETVPVLALIASAGATTQSPIALAEIPASRRCFPALSQAQLLELLMHALDGVHLVRWWRTFHGMHAVPQAWSACRTAGLESRPCGRLRWAGMPSSQPVTLDWVAKPKETEALMYHWFRGGSASLN